MSRTYRFTAMNKFSPMGPAGGAGKSVSVNTQPVSGLTFTSTITQITFADLVDGTSDTSDWTYVGSVTGDLAPTAVLANGTTSVMTLTHTNAVQSGETLTLNYDGTGDFTVAGVAVEAIVDFDVTNTI